MDDKINDLKNATNAEKELIQKEENAKKNIRRILRAVFFACVLIALLSVYSYIKGQFSGVDNSMYREISNYVTENEKELEEYSLKRFELRPEGSNEVVDYFSAEGVFENGDSRIFQFIYEEKSAFRRGAVYGYYYSVNDKPARFCGDAETGSQLSEFNDDTWTYLMHKNEGATKRIKEHWFYFEYNF